MGSSAPCILTVNTADSGGGAEAISMALAADYCSMGAASYAAVGYRAGERHGLFTLSEIASTQRSFAERCVASLRRRFNETLGRHDFDFPNTWKLLDFPPRRPNILHIHNMHGGYFDLRALPNLSRQVPTVLTLHDAWTLSGHCAHSFDCDRWRTGCGSCPDLTIPPAIQRDGTAYNWRRKKDIYSKARVYVATPCAWLMSKVKDSILSPAIVESRVIPNGVDTSVFRPAHGGAARAELGIPLDANVVLFAGNKIRHNRWKDFDTIRQAVAILSRRLRGRPLLAIGIGDDTPPERAGDVEIRFVPYKKSPAMVAKHYQAADVYLHAAHADTFPNTVIEALACGTPVVATAIGGIPEQVIHESTGFLVAHRDAEAMATATERLLVNEPLLARMSAHAARDARFRFGRQRQAEAYFSWFEAILGQSVLAQACARGNRTS